MANMSGAHDSSTEATVSRGSIMLDNSEDAFSGLGLSVLHDSHVLSFAAGESDDAVAIADDFNSTAAAATAPATETDWLHSADEQEQSAVGTEHTAALVSSASASATWFPLATSTTTSDFAAPVVGVEPLSWAPQRTVPLLPSLPSTAQTVAVHSVTMPPSLPAASTAAFRVQNAVPAAVTPAPVHAALPPAISPKTEQKAPAATSNGHNHGPVAVKPEHKSHGVVVQFRAAAKTPKSCDSCSCAFLSRAATHDKLRTSIEKYDCAVVHPVILWLTGKPRSAVRAWVALFTSTSLECCLSTVCALCRMVSYVVLEIRVPGRS